MKEINVEVCVCSQCVMNGSMNIIDQIEGMNKLEIGSPAHSHIKVTMSKMLGIDNPEEHGKNAPYVWIEGEMIRKADSETVMDRILQVDAQR